jgi:methionyl-tRNA formyltransferase
LRLLLEIVGRFSEGDEPPAVAQDEAAATWAPEPEGDALRVDWSWAADRILRRIRALAPVPGLALSLSGLEVFVTRAEPAPEYPAALLPGEVARWGPGKGRVIIRTGDGAVALTRAFVDEQGCDEPVLLGACALAERFAAHQAVSARSTPRL